MIADNDNQHKNDIEISIEDSRYGGGNIDITLDKDRSIQDGKTIFQPFSFVILISTQKLIYLFSEIQIILDRFLSSIQDG